MNKILVLNKIVCGMCVYFRMGRCTKKDYKLVDCLDRRCDDDFKGYFDKGD